MPQPSDRKEQAHEESHLRSGGEDSVILDRSGAILDTLSGKNWFWHNSGEALDRSTPPPPGESSYAQPVLNYRLSDGRLMQLGQGLVIGHGHGPAGSGPAASDLITLTADPPLP